MKRWTSTRGSSGPEGPGSARFSAWPSPPGEARSGGTLRGSTSTDPLSTGAFNPRTSDIDVLVTTRMLTDGPANERLQEVHRAMHGWGDDRWADRLEAMFIPAKALAMPGIPSMAVLELHQDDGFKVQALGPDLLIQRRILRRVRHHPLRPEDLKDRGARDRRRAS